MRGIQSFLGDAILQKEALRAARAQIVLREWPEIVGDKLAEKSWPDRFDHGVVWVAVNGSAWAQELRMMREMIVERLNERSGEKGLFRDIRFGVRPLKKAESSPVLVEESGNDEGLSIREIAERRMRKFRDATGD